LCHAQEFISSFQYNHSPGYHFNSSKHRPFSSIMNTARDIMRAPLPIKCIEAVFLGLLLTCGWKDLDRIPVGFKSRANGQSYRWVGLPPSSLQSLSQLYTMAR
jgi:tubulinyl-Tyr carboxypeptidase